MPQFSPLASPSATRAFLERHDLYAKHHLGQNFLISDWVVGKIVDLAELSSADTVLEVGPGIGTLTYALLKRAALVVALEADQTLEPALHESCAEQLDKLHIVWGDALKTLTGSIPAEPNKFVANLPYQVAATLVLSSFERLESIERAVVMVQAEVADRMAAQPKTKAYGAYTAKLALYARVTGRFEVAASNFMPAPHVTSSVIRLERSEAHDPDTGNALSRERLEQTSHVINAAFLQRRKTLRNSLAADGFEKVAIDVACEAASIDASCRAETLSPLDFVRLTKELERVGQLP
ncbi:MAG: 16S rRNA (adenine(1518)-N(6)/adenine(1519)-N(6))-dimethyltransferase RsmA [Atopobiaceae bacterium]|nr:16S rRNA (adenine(1518)-N(6)/adenine(1519)-N(6))-dimethyltransferase RsmA [Atopobiaceae bacterium]